MIFAEGVTPGPHKQGWRNGVGAWGEQGLKGPSIGHWGPRKVPPQNKKSADLIHYFSRGAHFPKIKI